MLFWWIFRSGPLVSDPFRLSVRVLRVKCVFKGQWLIGELLILLSHGHSAWGCEDIWTAVHTQKERKRSWREMQFSAEFLKDHKKLW